MNAKRRHRRRRRRSRQNQRAASLIYSTFLKGIRLGFAILLDDFRRSHRP